MDLDFDANVDANFLARFVDQTPQYFGVVDPDRVGDGPDEHIDVPRERLQQSGVVRRRLAVRRLAAETDRVHVFRDHASDIDRHSYAASDAGWSGSSQEKEQVKSGNGPRRRK